MWHLSVDRWFRFLTGADAGAGNRIRSDAPTVYSSKPDKESKSVYWSGTLCLPEECGRRHWGHLRLNRSFGVAPVTGESIFCQQGVATPLWNPGPLPEGKWSRWILSRTRSYGLHGPQGQASPTAAVEGGRRQGCSGFPAGVFLALDKILMSLFPVLPDTLMEILSLSA